MDFDSSVIYFIDDSIRSFFFDNSLDLSETLSNDDDIFPIISFIDERFLENIEDFRACSLSIDDVAIVSVFINDIVLIIVAKVSCMVDTD